MQQKSKRQLLDQRLERIKRNSEELIKKIDTKINTMQEVKNDLNDKSQRITNWTNKFESLMIEMAEKMLNLEGSCSIGNPLKENPNSKQKPRKQSIKFVSQKIRAVKSICVLTGAGVSKNVGIPTFRGKDGLYSKKFVLKKSPEQTVELPPEQFLTLETFRRYPDQIWQWCNKTKQLMKQKNPGREHQLVNELCVLLRSQGSEVCLVTTNIDGLHKIVREKNADKQLYAIWEIHGNFNKNLCLQCEQFQPGQLNPKQFVCTFCSQRVLRPYIMFFDQRYNATFDPISLSSRQFDLTITIGSSLQTGLPNKIVANSGTFVEINLENQCVTKSGNGYWLQGDCGEILQKIVAQIKAADQK